MANYIVTDNQLTGIADAIRAKTGGSGGIEFPTGFVSGIGGLTDTSDADATAANIRKNKTAYVNGEKITGTYVPIIAYSASGAVFSKEFTVGSGSYTSGNTVTQFSVPESAFLTSISSANFNNNMNGKLTYTTQNKTVGGNTYIGTIIVKASTTFTQDS